MSRLRDEVGIWREPGESLTAALRAGDGDRDPRRRWRDPEDPGEITRQKWLVELGDGEDYVIEAVSLGEWARPPSVCALLGDGVEARRAFARAVPR